MPATITRRTDVQSPTTILHKEATAAITTTTSQLEDSGRGTPFTGRELRVSAVSCRPPTTARRRSRHTAAPGCSPAKCSACSNWSAVFRSLSSALSTGHCFCPSPWSVHYGTQKHIFFFF